MTSTSAPTNISFRVFSSSDVKGGAAVALGRLHASWFLVLARPDEVQMIRAFRCINFILPDDPTAIAALSAGGKHLFAVGGHLGDTLMDELTSLLDHEGRAPVKVVEAYPEDHPSGLCALVEVLVPDEELIYACARCGKWEAQFGPRFPRCSGCKSRYYCSAEVGEQLLSVLPHSHLTAFLVPEGRLEASISPRGVCPVERREGVRGRVSPQAAR